MQTSAGLISGFVKETDMGNAKENKREWKLSEVVQETGLSRKALQEYDRLGIVSPTSKTEGGYWLYDDKAVDKLRIVATFRDVGYKRAEIKELLSGAQGDNVQIISENLGTAIEKLQKQRDRIDSVISLLKFEQDVFDRFSEKIRNQVEYLKAKNFRSKVSTADSFSKAVNFMSFIGYDENTREEIRNAMESVILLHFFGAYVDEEPDSDIVKAKMRELFDAWEQYILGLSSLPAEQREEYGKMQGKEKLESTRDFMFLIAEAQTPENMQNAKTQMDVAYGAGTYDKMKDMINKYIEIAG
jgi:DNA-binding transcriptional MerR regulator